MIMKSNNELAILIKSRDKFCNKKKKYPVILLFELSYRYYNNIVETFQNVKKD